MIDYEIDGEDITVTGTDDISQRRIAVAKLERQVKHLREENLLLRNQVDSLEDEMAVVMTAWNELRESKKTEMSNRFIPHEGQIQ